MVAKEEVARIRRNVENASAGRSFHEHMMKTAHKDLSILLAHTEHVEEEIRTLTAERDRARGVVEAARDVRHAAVVLPLDEYVARRPFQRLATALQKYDNA